MGNAKTNTRVLRLHILVMAGLPFSLTVVLEAVASSMTMPDAVP